MEAWIVMSMNFGKFVEKSKSSRGFSTGLSYINYSTLSYVIQLT